MLLNVKMSTIVGILTFISMINTPSENLKASKFLFFSILVFMSSWNFMLSWERSGSVVECLTQGRGPQVQASPASLHCVIEQEHLS